MTIYKFYKTPTNSILLDLYLCSLRPQQFNHKTYVFYRINFHIPDRNAEVSSYKETVLDIGRKMRKYVFFQKEIDL